MTRHILAALVLLLFTNACMETVSFTPDSIHDPNSPIYVPVAPTQGGMRMVDYRDDNRQLLYELRLHWRQFHGVADSFHVERTLDGLTWESWRRYPYENDEIEYAIEGTIAANLAFRVTSEYEGPHGLRVSNPIIISLPPVTTRGPEQSHGNLILLGAHPEYTGWPPVAYVSENNDIPGFYRRSWRIYGEFGDTQQLLTQGSQFYPSADAWGMSIRETEFTPNLYQIREGIGVPFRVKAEVTYSVPHRGVNYPIVTLAVDGGWTPVPYIRATLATYENGMYLMRWNNNLSNHLNPQLIVDRSEDFGETWTQVATLPYEARQYQVSAPPGYSYRVRILRDGEWHPQPLNFYF
jgi:hypothetical protein